MHQNRAYSPTDGLLLQLKPQYNKQILKATGPLLQRPLSGRKVSRNRLRKKVDTPHWVGLDNLARKLFPDPSNWGSTEAKALKGLAGSGTELGSR